MKDREAAGALLLDGGRHPGHWLRYITATAAVYCCLAFSFPPDWRLALAWLTVAFTTEISVQCGGRLEFREAGLNYYLEFYSWAALDDPWVTPAGDLSFWVTQANFFGIRRQIKWPLPPELREPVAEFIKERCPTWRPPEAHTTYVKHPFQ
ncbi:MAG: hypothetical protein ACRC1K_26995 [Planctomycetia bacterium]